MAVTRAEIALRALRESGKIPFGQGGDPNMVSATEQAYDEVYSFLEELGIVDWASTASVPNEYSFFIVALTAYSMIGQLGTPSARVLKITRDASTAEQEIRRVFNSGYTPDPVKIEDF